MKFIERLGKEWLFFDGGMGALLQERGLAAGELPETWNITHPEEIQSIHRTYLDAGSDIINTNTFGANALKFPDNLREIVESAVSNAKEARRQSGREDAYIALDLGPTGRLLQPMGDLPFEQAVELFGEVVRIGAAAGVDLVLIETMSDSYELKAAVLAAKENCDLPVLATVIFDEKGKMLTGGTVDSAVAMLEGLRVDALGVNCGLGPKQMLPIVKRLTEVSSLPVIVNPNAGLPRSENGKTVYDIDADEFAALMGEIADLGVQVLGGCCGTTPAHIAALRAELDALPQRTEAAPAAKLSTGTAPAVEKDDAFLRKLNAGEKVIAIELDSPRVADLSGYLDGARRLQAAGADLLTIADCPIAQARMDSSLVACRVHRELGMCALPHMTCRDRNLNATKALLLGLYAEGVREVLAITGDPIPTAERDEVKNVYQFNSRKLAQYIVSLAGEGREMPSAMTVLGALNLNARNFDVELRRAVEKLENGMSGFLTQPVLSAQAVENLRKARQTLGERAKILAGIMPVVSQRNAIFMENEINGIHVEEDIIQRFAGLDREQGEALGLEVSMQMAREALP